MPPLHPLFNFLASLSLLLLISLTLLCLSGPHLGSVRSINSLLTFTTRDANLGFFLLHDPTADPTGKPFEPFRDTEVVTGNARALSHAPLTLWSATLGPTTTATTPPLTGHVLLLPWQWWTLLLATLPTTRLILSLPGYFRARTRAHRHRANLCPTCGYDLRVQLAQSEGTEPNVPASPARCPECGHPTPSANTPPITAGHSAGSASAQSAAPRRSPQLTNPPHAQSTSRPAHPSRP